MGREGGREDEKIRMARVASDECPYPILERFIRFREFILEGMGEGEEG